MKLKALILVALLSTTPVWAQKSDQPEKPATPKQVKAPNIKKPTPKPEVESPKKDSTSAEKSSKTQQLPPAQRIAAYSEFLEAQKKEGENNFVQAVDGYKKVIELDPTAPEPYVSLGELYFNNRNLRDAEAAARKAINLDKDSLGAHRLLGRVLAVESSGNSNSKDQVQEAIVEFLEVVRLDKQDPEAWRFLGSLYIDNGEEDRALKAFQNHISTGLANFADYYQLARLYYGKNQYREAAQAARQAFEQSENNPQAGVLLANALLRSGQTNEAIDIFKMSLKDGMGSPAVKLGLCEALVYAGRYEEATKQINEILEKETTNLRALNLLSQVQRRTGKRQEAVETLKRALKGQDISDSLELQFELAETYGELDQTDNAIAAYEEAFNTLANPDGSVSESNKRSAGYVLQSIMNTYRNASQRDKAFQTIERMRKALGKDSTVPDEITIGLLTAEGKYQEAVEIARKAKGQFPKEKRFVFLEAQALGELHQADEAMTVLKPFFTGSAEDADVHQVAAFVMLSSSRTDEAEKQIRKALQYDEKNIGYLITLSSIQDRAKKYTESEATLRDLLKIDPNNATALNNLGYFLTERNERLKEAQEFIQRAVDIEPNNGSFLDSLGWIYFKLGDLTKAQKYLEESTLYDRRSVAAQEHLGDLYQRLGRTEEAIKHWKKALEFANETEEIARINGKIKNPNKAVAEANAH